TYLAGSADDLGWAIALDNNNNAIVAGETGSFDFITLNAYDSSGAGISLRRDLFILKLGEYQKPSTPQSLVAGSTEIETDYINLVWERPSSDGNDPHLIYRIYRGTTNGIYTILAETSNSVYLDISATPGQIYYYVISAVNTFGESDYSTEESAIIITIPDSPQNVIYNNGDNFIYLSWTAPVNDGGSPIQYYQVHRGSTSGQYDFSVITNETHFNDTSIFGGRPYFYVVTSINRVGESDLSGEISVTTTGLTKQDTSNVILTETITLGEVTVTHTSTVTEGTLTSQSESTSNGSGDVNFAIWSFLLGVILISVVFRITKVDPRIKRF
ncbi:MAG: fibronectin type III domain-containing protein, partial [Candidatus Heimdallarchaeota archaeon]|nr:fibronectin type III domain-containing protein [Candidatus Heimdallarchaeota archaeon]